MLHQQKRKLGSRNVAKKISIIRYLTIIVQKNIVLTAHYSRHSLYSMFTLRLFYFVTNVFKKVKNAGGMGEGFRLIDNEAFTVLSRFAVVAYTHY